MKRRQILKHLKSHGCELLREGKNHTVYYNPVKGKTSTVPRHTEVDDTLANKICNDNIAEFDSSSLFTIH